MAKKAKVVSGMDGGKVFVGLMFVGLGMGILFGRADAGVLIGLGVGFLGMAFVKHKWPDA